MKRIVKALAISAIVAILAPSSVLAADYMTDAINALQHSNVYVAPDTEGTNKDTTGELQAKLTRDDNIVLVMLPATAETALGVDISTIASRLSEKLGNQRIIGLAVGNKVVGYAPSLPTGVAADQMEHAQSVSNDPITALGTFAHNVHIWQEEHPQPQPTQPVQGAGFPIWVFLLICVILAFVLLYAGNKWLTSSTDETRFNAPSPVKALLHKIAQERMQVEDLRLRGTILQICKDIEKYFQSSSGDRKSESSIMAKSLTQVERILAKYIDVQNNGRYYDENTDDLLDQGKSALEDFSAYVLESIRNGNKVALKDYKLNAYILEAQRNQASLK